MKLNILICLDMLLWNGLTMPDCVPGLFKVYSLLSNLLKSLVCLC